MEHERYFVERISIGRIAHRVYRNIAEIRDLALQGVGQRLLAATHDRVGLNTAGAQLGHRMLRRLGLLLTRWTDERHQRHVHVAHVVAADIEAELPNRLEEREDLDVADGAADLGDHDVDVVVRETADTFFDLVRDVGDDLNGTTEVVAPALRRDHRRVDRTGSRVRRTGQVLVDEPLVVPEVEIGLAAVIGNEHLAVLEGVHGARVDVEIRIELLHRDPEAAALQETPERRGREPFPERAGHTTSHEDVLGHGTSP